MRSLLQDLLQELQNAFQVEEDNYNNLDEACADYALFVNGVVSYLLTHENLSDEAKEKLDNVKQMW